MLVSFRSGFVFVADETSGVATRERPGDHVQVCFLGEIRHVPGCDPSIDDRGRMYRVYDYKQHAAYVVMNSERMRGEN